MGQSYKEDTFSSTLHKIEPSPKSSVYLGLQLMKQSKKGQGENFRQENHHCHLGVTIHSGCRHSSKLPNSEYMIQIAGKIGLNGEHLWSIGELYSFLGDMLGWGAWVQFSLWPMTPFVPPPPGNWQTVLQVS